MSVTEQQFSALLIDLNYNINLFTTPGIMSVIKNAKLCSGVVNYSIASSFDDVAAIHKIIYPMAVTVNPETPQDPKLLHYFIVDINGEKKAYAIEWLTGVPTLSTLVKLQIVFDGFDYTKLDLLKNILAYNGFTNYTIVESN